MDNHAPHVEAINAQGLTVEREGKATTTRVRAVLSGDLSHGLELVMLAVKSHQTGDALGVLVPRLAAGGTVVSLQNGLSEEQIARALGPARTVGCLVNWAADWVAPGRILHGGHGAFVLGELDGRITPRVQELASLLSAVEQTRVTTTSGATSGPSSSTAPSSSGPRWSTPTCTRWWSGAPACSTRWWASWARGWRWPTRRGCASSPSTSSTPPGTAPPWPATPARASAP